MIRCRGRGRLDIESSIRISAAQCGGEKRGIWIPSPFFLTLVLLSQLTAAALYMIRRHTPKLPESLPGTGPAPDVVLVKPMIRCDDASLDRLRRWIESARAYPGRATVVVATLGSLAPRVIESLGSRTPDDVRIIDQSDEARRREPGLDKAHRLVAAEQLLDSLFAGDDGVVISSDEDVEPLDHHCVERLVAGAPYPGTTATVTYTEAPRHRAPWWQGVAHANLAFNNQIFATNAAFFERLHGLILGWTTVIWRSDLRAIGGFASATKYLTEDVVLGNALARRGVHTRLFTSDAVLQIVDSLHSVSDLWRQQIRWRAHLRTLHPALLALITLGLPFSTPTLASAALLLVHPSPISIALLASALFLSAKTLRVATSQLWTIPCHELLTLASHGIGMLTRRADWGPWRYELDMKARILAKIWQDSLGEKSGVGIHVEAHQSSPLSSSLHR